MRPSPRDVTIPTQDNRTQAVYGAAFLRSRRHEQVSSPSECPTTPRTKPQCHIRDTGSVVAATNGPDGGVHAGHVVDQGVAETRLATDKPKGGDHGGGCSSLESERL
jgi:hypothetical protein